MIDVLVRAGRHAHEHVGFHPRVDLGVLEHRLEVGCSGHCVADLLELPVHHVEGACVLCCLEDGAGIDAVGDGYDRLPSSWPKSISASASSINLLWSAPVSDLRVIFSAASRLSLPTSSRISPSACWVACSI